MGLEARSTGDDSSRIEKYENHVRELQQKIVSKEADIEHSQVFIARSQAVNDCLNTLLVLESEQTSLYEMACPIQDDSIRTQLEAKKTKAHHVIERLNDIVNEDERPSIAFLQKGIR